MQEKKIINNKGYRQDYYPPVPTNITKFFRKCKIWQFIRFIAINIKMLKIVSKSH